MRTLSLSQFSHIDLFADEPEGVIGDIYHLVRNKSGGSARTPVGHFAAIPEPALPEQPARSRVEACFRADLRYNPANHFVLVDSLAGAPHYPPELPDLLADLLLRETACTEPMLVNIWEGRNTSFVTRGQVSDEE